MTVIPINLAIEDDLSEAVLLRLLRESTRYATGASYGRSGFGYLRSTITGWNRAAKGMPFIVLTDLDHHECPPALKRDWLPEPQSPNLMLRIAVREVEAWLLADRGNLAQFLRVSRERLPHNPDLIADPKALLIELARRSQSREVRARIAPKAGSTAKQGPEYNVTMSTFVRDIWDIAVAKENSPSLARTVTRIMSFVPVWPPVPS